MSRATAPASVIFHRQTHSHARMSSGFRIKPAQQPRGFALVVTLSLMILLTLIAVGLLSLSAVALRTSSQGQAMSTARANARLALMLAIGELQKNAGPDQRVTARADILQSAGVGTTAPVNGRWTGVWRTDRLKTESATASPLLGRGTDGSIRDRRSNANSSQPTYKASEQVLTWLVTQSGGPTSPDAAVALPQDESVLLVGPGAVDRPEDEVLVPKLMMPSNGGGQARGMLAWWVGGENAKATFNLPVPEEGPTVANPWHAAAQSGINAIATFPNYEVSSVQQVVPRAVTRESAVLTGSMGSPQDKVPFHDITCLAEGVLADSLNGGLRRDLTAFLATGSAPALGNKRPALDVNTPIYGTDAPATGTFTNRLAAITPKFGVLRDWSRMAADTSPGAVPEITPVAPNGLAGALVFNQTNISLTNRFGSGSAPNLFLNQTGAIHPVLLEASVSVGVSLKPVNPSTTGNQTVATSHRIRLHYFPRVVLWNPYNAKLTARDYVVQVNMPAVLNLSILGLPSGTASIDLENDLTSSVNSGGTLNVNTPRCPYFRIPAVSLEPGECLLFTADAGSSANNQRSWGSSTNLADYPLSCSKPFPLVDNFYLDKNETVSVAPDQLQSGNVRYTIAPSTPWSSLVASKYPAPGSPWEGKQLQYWQKLWMSNPGASGLIKDISNKPAQYSPLQAWVQTETAANFTNAPWITGVPASLAEVLHKHDTSEPLYPYYRMKWGHRVQWLKETDFNQNTAAGPYNPPYLGYNTLANHNLRSGLQIPSPVENRLRSSAAGGRYTHGILIDDIYGWEWRNLTYAPVPVGGKNRVSPFGLPGLFGGQTFPLLDLPRPDAPLVSLAALQHAPVSQLPWHPLNAMGNSLADPRVRRNRTINYFTKAQWGDAWDGIRQSNISTDTRNAAYLHDLSYELNHAFWDKFFLSTVPAAPLAYTPGQPLANPRLVLNPSGIVTTEDLRDVNRAAATLLTRGAFNVNSTSTDAWAALLASFRADPELTLNQPGGTVVKMNDVFSRLFSPPGKEYNGQGYTEAEMWSGYRKLTDAQIRALAEAIVAEVKARGPFLSISDFVNRRLMDPPTTSTAETAITKTGLKGTLQAAIDRAGINQTITDAMRINKSEYHMEPSEPDSGSYPNVTTSGKPDYNHWADGKLTGAPACITQADMLQKLGPVLTARDDTFIIRTCGQALSNTGKEVLATAWCEAIVQRLPEPVKPDPVTLIDPALESDGSDRFGRRFVIRSFRWLQNEEI
jgi:Tfp pilus assembly protein PilX